MWLYLKRRPLRILIFVLVVAIGVATSMALSSIFLSFGETRGRISKATEDWIVVQYFSQDLRDAKLDSIVEQALESSFGFSSAIKVDIAYLGYNLYGSARANFPVYGIRQTDISKLLKVSDTEISRGTVFSADSREIMAPESFLKANGVDIGEVYEERRETATSGQYSIVASLRGPAVFGLGPSGISDTRGLYGYIVFAEDGFLMVLENELRDTLTEHAEHLFVSGPASSLGSFEEQYRTYYTGVISIYILISLVFTLGLTMLNSVSIRERKKEYGIMSALGYTHGFLRTRLLLESCIQAAAGWVMGLFLGSWVVGLLERRLFEPNGLFGGNVFYASILTAVIPVAVVFLTQILISGSLKRDLLSLLRSANTTSGFLRSRFRKLSLGWLSYPLRSGSYRPLFINGVLFIALIFLFGSLLAGLGDGIRDGGAIFQKTTYAQGPGIDSIDPVEGVSGVFPASIERASIKLLFGTGDVHIPVLSPESAGYLLFLNEEAVEGTLYASDRLAEQLTGNIEVPFEYSGIEKSDLLSGLSGVLVRSLEDYDGVLYTYSDPVVAQRIRHGLLNMGNVFVFDSKTFKRQYMEETQFMDLLVSIIVYLQLFVLLVISVVTSVRVIALRRQEISIRSIIGIKRAETRTLFSGETVSVMLLASIVGAVIGLGSWYVIRLLLFPDIYISSTVSLATVFRVIALIGTVIVSSMITVKFFSERSDPIAIIKR
jgi:putative ABC transport system permease protein